MTEENTTIQPPEENDTVQQSSSQDNDLENLKKECEEYKSGWMRAQADYQNLQKEVERKRSEWVKMSEAQILEDFIPVYDNFKKAFADHTDDADLCACLPVGRDVADNADNEKVKRWDNWKKGIGYIMKQFGDILSRYNIETIKTVGEKFDPVLHEAVGEEESEDKDSGTIIREVESGYKAGNRIIKCAKVIVAK